MPLTTTDVPLSQVLWGMVLQLFYCGACTRGMILHPELVLLGPLYTTLTLSALLNSVGDGVRTSPHVYYIHTKTV